MNINFLPSFRINASKIQNIKNNNNQSNSIKLNTLNADTVTFSGRVDLYARALGLDENDYPNLELRQEILSSLKENNDTDIPEVHKNYYSALLDCETFEEAKEIYPELSSIKDAKNLDLSKFHHASIFRFINDGKYDGLNLENLTLEFLKKYYGQAISPAKKDSVEQYYGMSLRSIDRIMEELNMKMPKNYAKLLESSRKIIQTKEHWKDDDYRKAMSEKMKIQWENPEFKEIRAKSLEEQWQNEEFRESMHQKGIERFNDPKRRQMASEYGKAFWQNPENRGKLRQSLLNKWQDEDFRKKMSEKTKAQWQDEDFRKKMSEKTKAQWQDEDFRERMAQVHQEIWSNDEMREAASQRAKERWQDPEYREKMSEISKARWQDPEYRAKMRDVMAELWADESFRDKMNETRQETWSNNDLRQQASIRAKEKWQDETYQKRMKVTALAKSMAWDMRPDVKQIYKDMLKEFPYAEVLAAKKISKIPLTEDEKSYMRCYMKACHNANPTADKEIGQLQKDILKSWGYYDNDCDIDSILAMFENK